MNRKKVFNHLYFSDFQKTKKELAQELSLSLPTINQNINELCSAGLIRESKSSLFTGGRHASVLEIVPDSFFSVGISITDINLRFVLTNIKFEEIAYKRIAYEVRDFENEIGEIIANELDFFVKSCEIDKTKILGVGIAIPALIDKKSEKIIISPTLKLKDVPYRFLTKSIPFVTFVENDGTASGACESFLRPDTSNMAYISLENGVGGSIIIDRKNYIGDNVKSAEFGHMCVEVDGLSCSCGKKGCLEAYCNAARFSDNLGISLETFNRELQNGNKKYRKMWKDMLKHLALAIGNIRTTLDCSIVLGGFLVQIIAPYFDTLKEYVKENLYAESSTEFLSLCKRGNKSVPMGMALHFLKEYIKSI